MSMLDEPQMSRERPRPISLMAGTHTRLPEGGQTSSAPTDAP